MYVVLSTKSNHVALKGFDKVKYEINKYHAERYWGIFVAGLLIWFWVLGYPWMPPVAFDAALKQPQNIHTVKVTAGQWYWMLEDGGYSQNANDTSNNTKSNRLYIKAGETVKFVA